MHNAQPATIVVHRQSSSQVNINFYQTFFASKMDGLAIIIQPIPNQWTTTEISLHSWYSFYFGFYNSFSPFLPTIGSPIVLLLLFYSMEMEWMDGLFSVQIHRCLDANDRMMVLKSVLFIRFLWIRPIVEPNWMTKIDSINKRNAWTQNIILLSFGTRIFLQSKWKYVCNGQVYVYRNVWQKKVWSIFHRWRWIFSSNQIAAIIISTHALPMRWKSDI